MPFEGQLRNGQVFTTARLLAGTQYTCSGHLGSKEGQSVSRAAGRPPPPPQSIFIFLVAWTLVGLPRRTNGTQGSY
ncbi:hypothetical protein CJ030_MR7G013489 [Morella rubra]|uniref:Uncharacterized protein n=1 Tax=Morella rubra TaxID=262757 RepID=A0A6A1V231_9ROSI|nr:hypothetical protein CJ030_MR7G013489 [Morella rubra]